jgi:hypothetical protein
MDSIKKEVSMPDSITRSPMAPISPKEASAYTGYSERTLASWRRGRKEWAPDSKGPRYATMNGRIWYRLDWLDDWLESVWAPHNSSEKMQ